MLRLLAGILPTHFFTPTRRIWPLLTWYKPRSSSSETAVIELAKSRRFALYLCCCHSMTILLPLSTFVDSLLLSLLLLLLPPYQALHQEMLPGHDGLHDTPLVTKHAQLGTTEIDHACYEHSNFGPMCNPMCQVNCTLLCLRICRSLVGPGSLAPMYLPLVPHRLRSGTHTPRIPSTTTRPILPTTRRCSIFTIGTRR